MTSHAAAEILSIAPTSDGRVHARLRLVCGCVFEGGIAADRVLDGRDADGAETRIAVGKYRCPLDHPVGHTSNGAP